MSLKAEDVDACDACRNGDHGKCPDPDKCGCEYMDDVTHSDAEIESLCAQLVESKKGRERDREEFRKGVEAWQKKIREAEERVAELEKDREEWHDPTHLYGVEHPCPKCGGLGRRSYPNTTMWRGGAGGQMLSTGICDVCWGSGEAHQKGDDLRKMESRFLAVEVEAARYKDALESFAGSKDLGRVFPVLQHIALRALNRDPYKDHKPGCPIITVERVPKKYATYCTCSQDSPSKENP